MRRGGKMKKSLMRISSVLAILILVLTVVGCQGYQAPDYKGPEETDDGDVVEIDVSDIGEDSAVDDTVDEAPRYREVTYPEPEVKTAATVVESSKADYKPVTYEEADDDESDFKKSAYKPVKEEEGVPSMTVTEGDLVQLNIKATDADGDILTYRFTSPLNSEGKWQTRFGDAGVYYSMITVSDGKTEVEKKVKIIVEPENNKPVLQFIPDINVKEGQTVEIAASATDKDGQKLTYTFSGWMTSSTKEVGYNEEGEHTVVVSVTDGISTVSQEVTVYVADVNRPPEVEIEL